MKNRVKFLFSKKKFLKTISIETKTKLTHQQKLMAGVVASKVRKKRVKEIVKVVKEDEDSTKLQQMNVKNIIFLSPVSKY